MSDITMYGTPTCKDCVIAKQVFNELGTEYEFININGFNLVFFISSSLR
jgi:glutaredoxin-related protein